MGDECRGHLVGDRPGLDLAVRWDGILQVDHRSAGAGPGQLGEHLGAVAGGEQQAAHGEGSWCGHLSDATGSRTVGPDPEVLILWSDAGHVPDHLCHLGHGGREVLDVDLDGAVS